MIKIKEVWTKALYTVAGSDEHLKLYLKLVIRNLGEFVLLFFLIHAHGILLKDNEQIHSGFSKSLFEMVIHICLVPTILILLKLILMDLRATIKGSIDLFKK
jgi:hypothetical protein